MPNQAFYDEVHKAFQAVLVDKKEISWEQLVKAVRDAGIPVKNWLNVRRILQLLINQGILKRTGDLYVEVYEVRSCTTKSDEIAKQLLEFASKNDRLIYLKGRWLDEHEYEDFNQYKVEIEKCFEGSGYVVKKISKSFKIELEKDRLPLTLKIGAHSVNVLYGKVAS